MINLFVTECLLTIIHDPYDSFNLVYDTSRNMIQEASMFDIEVTSCGCHEIGCGNGSECDDLPDHPRIISTVSYERDRLGLPFVALYTDSLTWQQRC